MAKVIVSFLCLMGIHKWKERPHGWSKECVRCGKAWHYYGFWEK